MVYLRSPRIRFASHPRLSFVEGVLTWFGSSVIAEVTFKFYHRTPVVYSFSQNFPTMGNIRVVYRNYTSFVDRFCVYQSVMYRWTLLFDTFVSAAISSSLGGFAPRSPICFRYANTTSRRDRYGCGFGISVFSPLILFPSHETLPT
jgi:hypothetical protein